MALSFGAQIVQHATSITGKKPVLTKWLSAVKNIQL